MDERDHAANRRGATRDTARSGFWYPRTRRTTPERMDDPSCDPELVKRTFRQLAVVNRLLSRVRTLLLRFVIRDAIERGVTQITVLDVGAGGGDVARWLVDAGARRGLRVRVTCVDPDPRAVALAAERLRGVDGCEVTLASVFDVRGRWDYVISNHVLHHLSDDQIVEMLDHSLSICSRRIVWNDLLRSRLSVIGFAAFSTVMMRRSYGREDGLLSILRGFRPSELEALIDWTEWHTHACVGRLPPGRVYIVGDTPRHDHPAPSVRASSRSIR